MKHDPNYRGRYARIPMPCGCLYLDNAGQKWVTQDMRFVLVMPDGSRTVRLAEYFESFGNFGAIAYRVKGKRFSALPKSNDGNEMPLDGLSEIDALPHVFHVPPEFPHGSWQFPYLDGKFRGYEFSPDSRTSKE